MATFIIVGLKEFKLNKTISISFQHATVVRATSIAQQ